MRQPLSVSTKIWLSLSILIIGYSISIAIGFYLGRQTEQRLHRVAGYIYPAAKYSQAALSAFEEQVKQYKEAVLIGEESYFESARGMGKKVDESIRRVAGLKGIDPRKLDEAIILVNLSNAYTQSAQRFYPLLMENMIIETDNHLLPEQINQQALKLSRMSNDLKTHLALFADSFSNELNAELASIRSISIRHRYSNLIVFLVVLSVAVLFTSIIITRSVIRPLGQTFMLEKAVEQSMDGIVVADTAGSIKFVNNAWALMHGYEPGELVDSHISLFHTKAQFNDEFLSFNNSAISKGADAGEVGHKRKDGSTFPAMMTANVIREKTDKPLRLVYFARDISEQKHYEEELRKAKEGAELAARAKSNFLANISHEIRTPMNGIIGMVKLLLNSRLDDEQHEFAEIIRQSADSLLLIIEDILDFSKIEAGKLAIEEIEFDLVRTIEAAGDVLAIKAYQKQLDMFNVIDPDTPTFLKGDPHRLKQVLINLTGNAIKFTQKGEVTIHAEVLHENKFHATLKFTISDTGIGIPENRMDRLFKPFSQVDSSTTREFGGTGLGLVISKQIVEMMGGEIGVESTEGNGATFWFTAVFKKQAGSDKRTARLPAGIRDKKLLIISDNERERLILSSYLSSWGCRHQTAAEPGQALSLLTSAAEDGRSFDLAIIDASINNKEGTIPLDRSIKADARIKRTLLVHLTAYGRQNPDFSIKNHFAATLTKPLKRSQLFNCLMSLLFDQPEVPDIDLPPKRNAIPAPGSGKHYASHSVLIVEDNPVNQLLASRILEKLGFRVDIVNNGREAILALETKVYNIVLMDAQMPKMDGIEATNIIRSPESNVIDHNIPIIAVTAHAMKGDKERFLAAGMNDYIAKPFRMEQLYSVITKYINRIGE